MKKSPPAVWSSVGPLTNEDFSYPDEDFSRCGGKSIFLTHSHTRNLSSAIRKSPPPFKFERICPYFGHIEWVQTVKCGEFTDISSPYLGTKETPLGKAPTFPKKTDQIWAAIPEPPLSVFGKGTILYTSSGG